jgi:carbonic anhydrase/acetyltransferase-like protein (isoleucine patch superfamily)
MSKEGSVILPFQGVYPKIHESVFLAEGAQIIGDVEIGRESSVWFNAVIRGDVHYIRIGERTNIQDNCTLHVTHQKYPLIIGSDVTIGHGAIVHGATVEDYCLIGMGARILDNAKIHHHSLIAAGALVLEHFEVPEGTLVAGVPARVKRELTDEERKQIEQSAKNYLLYVQQYRTQR